MNTSAVSIDEYISSFPPEIQSLLEQMRITIRQAAPEAAEAIKYGIPTFVFHGNLVHFAAYKNHIGFYPTPSGIEHFKDELSSFKTSKGTVHFQIGKPLPLELTAKIVRFRVAENSQKAKINTIERQS